MMNKKGSKVSMRNCGDCRSSLERCATCIDSNTRRLDALEKEFEIVDEIRISVMFDFTDSAKEEFEKINVRFQEVKKEIFLLKSSNDKSGYNVQNNKHNGKNVLR